MAIVAGVQFGDLPAGSASFTRKWLEEPFRRISLRSGGNEGGRDAGLPIGRERKGLFETAQAKITQPGTHKITRLAWVQAPEIKLSFPAR